MPLLGRFTTVVNLGILEEMLSGLPEKTQLGVINTGLGVEIEVENAAALRIDGWLSKGDGSLRNDGMEFITKYGCRIGHFPQLIKDFRLVTDEFIPHRTYSERTSVHVHLDIRRFHEDQLRNLLILYTLLEEPLFQLAGKHRKENIFCVPIRQSMPGASQDPFTNVRNANKYTAMNLLCASEFGTIEFRHMEGTDDPIRLMRWILLLGLLKYAAQVWDTGDLQKEICVLKNSSQYEIFLRKIFYGRLDWLEWRQFNLDNAVSDSKVFFKKGLK